jgi:hypothetical protein
MRRRVPVVTLLAACATTAFFPAFGRATSDLGGFATVEVPRQARLEPPRLQDERATWVSFRLDRYHAWAIGSATPYRASLFLALHAPGATAASYDAAAAAMVDRLNGGGDGWRLLLEDAQWRVGEGRYVVDGLDEPTWRLAYRDPGRRVSALWQVYQRDWALADARAALVAMVESVHRVREPDFAEIADLPRREAAAAERRVEATLAWLADHGFGPLAPGVPVTRDGVTVELMTEPERRLMIYAPVAGTPSTPLPPPVSHGWWQQTDTGWDPVMPDGDYWPMPGTRRIVEATLVAPGPHHFLVRTIRLDEAADPGHEVAATVQAIAGRVRPR